MEKLFSLSLIMFVGNAQLSAMGVDTSLFCIGARGAQLRHGNGLAIDLVPEETRELLRQNLNGRLEKFDVLYGKYTHHKLDKTSSVILENITKMHREVVQEISDWQFQLEEIKKRTLSVAKIKEKASRRKQVALAYGGYGFTGLIFSSLAGLTALESSEDEESSWQMPFLCALTTFGLIRSVKTLYEAYCQNVQANVELEQAENIEFESRENIQHIANMLSSFKSIENDLFMKAIQD